MVQRRSTEATLRLAPRARLRPAGFNPLHALDRRRFAGRVRDDRNRVAYAEIHDDETAATAITVLRRAVDWFALTNLPERYR